MSCLTMVKGFNYLVRCDDFLENIVVRLRPPGESMSKIAKGSAQFKMGISQPAQLEQWLNDNPNAKGLAFVGRSNVGKSSLINTLFGRKTARTSKTPGRTREVNIFEFKLEGDNEETFFLFDLPGYGHADVNKLMSQRWEELMGLFFNKMPSRVLLLNLQDSRHPQQKTDLHFQDFIINFNHEAFLIFNKIDKLKTQKDRAKLEKQKPAIFAATPFFKQIYFVSAENSKGVPQLEDALVNYLLRVNLV
ncbi:MAG: ribosome biogenesis GTP-binding protein YsxC [Halobacteriovorax sp.]|nr:ribosome biogenesis GTP-binding protein YsxC [Halobacteriovorax sp.]